MSESADRDRIVEIARAYAREAGRDVDRYEVAGVESETARHFVLFHAPTGAPGDHFSVEVDDATGRAVMLIPGR